MDLNLKGKHALVTGGSHGIGLAIAKQLGAEGCKVAFCGRSMKKATEAAIELNKNSIGAFWLTADVLRSSDIKNVVQTVVETWGTLDILINNVGGGGRWGKESVLDTPAKVWIDVYNKNAMAAVYFTLAAIPHMKKQKWGRVVTIASIYGKEGGGRPWFNMSKSAEISLMKTLAMKADLVRHGITFNTVAPGNIQIPDTGWDIEMRKNLEKYKAMTDSLPLGRLGTPEEVANVVVFLCSDHASLVNGACIAVDGGESKSF
jgi:3-oxoacyl-[acyl-carrier protein] reductase